MESVRLIRPSVAALLTQLAVAVVLGVAALPQAFAPRVDPGAILGGNPQPIALLWLTLAVADLIWIVALSPSLAALLVERLAALEQQITVSTEARQPRLPRPDRLATLLLITFDAGLAEATIRQPLVAVLGALSPPSTVDATIAVVVLTLLLVMLIWVFVVLRPLVETGAWRVLDLFLATTGSQSTRTFFDEPTPTRTATSISLSESYRSMSFRRPVDRLDRAPVEPTIVAGRPTDQPTILAGRPEDQPTVVGGLSQDQPTIIRRYPEDQPTIVRGREQDQPTIVGNLPPTTRANAAPDLPTIVPSAGDSPTISPELGDSPTIVPQSGDSPKIVPHPVDAPKIEPSADNSPTIVPHPADNSPKIMPYSVDAPTIIPEGRDDLPRVAAFEPPIPSIRPEDAPKTPEPAPASPEPVPVEATVAPAPKPSREAAVRIVERHLDETDPFATQTGLPDDDTDPFLKQRSRSRRPDETQPDLLLPSESTER